MYKIYPLPNAEPVEVYCELAIAGGGFAFLSKSLTLRRDAQQIVNALFKDKKNVLLKLQKKRDRRESYTLIQPHPNYNDFPFGVLVNNYTGYTKPKNQLMKESSGSFPFQPPQMKITRVSNPTDASSSLKTGTQIPTACLRSCQTIIVNVHPITILATGSIKMMVSQYTGVRRPL